MRSFLNIIVTIIVVAIACCTVYFLLKENENYQPKVEKVDELKLIPEVFIEEMPIQWNEPG